MHQRRASCQSLASTTQSHAQITPEQTTGEITIPVSVFRKPPGSTTSNPMTFTITPSGPTQDFWISAAQPTQTVTRGGTSPNTVSVTAMNGFTGTVDLSLSGLPTGVTGSFTPASVTGGSGSSMLTIVAGTNATPANYTFNIIGTSGSLVHSVPVILVVN